MIKIGGIVKIREDLKPGQVYNNRIVTGEITSGAGCLALVENIDLDDETISLEDFYCTFGIDMVGELNSILKSK